MKAEVTDCEVCGGYGYLWDDAWHGRLEMHYTRERPCPAGCNGGTVTAVPDEREPT